MFPNDKWRSVTHSQHFQIKGEVSVVLGELFCGTQAAAVRIYLPQQQNYFPGTISHHSQPSSFCSSKNTFWCAELTSDGHNSNISDYQKAPPKRLKNDLGLKYLILFERNFPSLPSAQARIEKPMEAFVASLNVTYMEITVTTANLAVFGGGGRMTRMIRMISVPGCEGRLTELLRGARHSQEMSHRASVHWSTPPPQPSGTAWHAHTASRQSGSNKWGEVGRMSSGEHGRPRPALAEYAGRHPDRAGRVVKCGETL